MSKVKADAIVNTANPRPVIGSGTDSAGYKAAGEEQLLAEREKIGDIAPGHAVHTDAFDLDAKYVIHAVSPAWIDGNHGERDVLHACYRNSMALAGSLGCASVAFPLLATGSYGFPKDEALQIALSEINRFLLGHDMDVIMVVFDSKTLQLSEKLVGDIEEYIDEHAVGALREEEYRSGNTGLRRIDRERGRYLASLSEYSSADLAESDAYPDAREIIVDDAISLSSDGTQIIPEISGMSLDEILEHSEDTFQQRLLRLIDISGMDDVTVYKKANIDRKLFSKIRSKADYKPKKKTTVAFAIALGLDVEAMQDLLSRAETAFSPSNRFDLIITYFVTNRNYDIFEINAALFKYGEPLLGI